MALKPAAIRQSPQITAAARLRELQQALWSLPKNEPEVGKLEQAIWDTLQFAESDGLPSAMRAEALDLVSGVLKSKGFSEEILAEIEKRASFAASLMPGMEASIAYGNLKLAARRSKEIGRSQQTLF